MNIMNNSSRNSKALLGEKEENTSSSLFGGFCGNKRLELTRIKFTKETNK